MKFVISYSCGKDSTLALHKMLCEGHTPVGLLVMYNRDAGRSWFHGVDRKLLDKISESLEIPLILCESAGEDYHLALEEGLRKALLLGAECCAFGDIDIEDNAKWCKDRCDAVGIHYQFPLWHRNRIENTKELVSLGYRCVIKCVRNGDLPRSMLGRVLDDEVISEMEERGIDVCGENGEYHTVVLDGPIFHTPVSYECKEVLDFGNISVINIVLKE